MLEQCNNASLAHMMTRDITAYYKNQGIHLSLKAVCAIEAMLQKRMDNPLIMIKDIKRELPLSNNKLHQSLGRLLQLFSGK